MYTGFVLPKVLGLYGIIYILCSNPQHIEIRNQLLVQSFDHIGFKSTISTDVTNLSSYVECCLSIDLHSLEIIMIF